MTRRPVVIVFAKAPRLGAVKTRLAAGIGDLAALRVYRAMLGTTLRRMARDPRWRTLAAVTPDRCRLARDLAPRGLRQVAQGRGDLGRRMMRALAGAVPAAAVVIGADIPDATADRVAAALRLLARSDVVFGPARDGGYWLVGIRRRRRSARLLDDARWSTAYALADSLAALPAHWRVSLAEILEDVDDAAALARYAATAR